MWTWAKTKKMFNLTHTKVIPLIKLLEITLNILFKKKYVEMM